jgi:hypothetical protein
VNVAGIELAQPLINPLVRTRAGGVSVPLLASRNLAGFLSLLNGLLDQTGTATDDVAYSRAVKQPGVTSLPQAMVSPQAAASPPAALRPQAGAKPQTSMKPQAATKPQTAIRGEKGDTTGNPTDASVQNAQLRAMASGATAGTPFLIQAGEISSGLLTVPRSAIALPSDVQGSSAGGQSQSDALRSLGATNISSGGSSPNTSPPGAVRDIAFALRLTPGTMPGANTPGANIAGANGNAVAATNSGSNGVPPGASGPRNAMDVRNPTGSSGLKEVVTLMDSAETKKMAIPIADPAPVGSPSSRGNPPLSHAGSSSLQSILSYPLSPNSTGSEVPGLRSRETGGRIRNGDVNVSSASPDQSPVSTPANPAEIDAPPQGLTGNLATAAGKVSVLSPPGTRGQDATTPNHEARVESSTSLDIGQEQAPAPEPATARRSPLSPPESIARTQGTAPSDSANMTGRDMGNSESDGKAPRIPIAEKAPQIQLANQPSGHASAGVWMDRVAEPAVQTHSKIPAPQPQAPPTASPELETANASQAPPVREISFRIEAASANVEVQVAQRAGKVQVAVRTADPDLAKSLQTNLGDLVGRLEDKGYKTETWTPVTAQHGTAAVREPSNSANSQSQSGNPGSQGGEQDQQRGQQESNRQRQGRWQTQLEETLRAPIATIPEEETS